MFVIVRELFPTLYIIKLAKQKKIVGVESGWSGSKRQFKNEH